MFSSSLVAAGSDWFPTMLGLADIDFDPADGYELDGYDHHAAWASAEVPRDYVLYNDYYNAEVRENRIKLQSFRNNPICLFICNW